MKITKCPPGRAAGAIDATRKPWQCRHCGKHNHPASRRCAICGKLNSR